jgi:epoxyqueuosine reductase
MTWLDASRDERLDPARVLPSLRSVISVACVYNADPPESLDSLRSLGTGPEPRAPSLEPGRAVVARYARGEDYHEVLRRRLRELVQWLADTCGPGLEAFSCVDNGPVQERVFAEQAGLGWIGKNTCLISPRLGSWLVLGEIFTNLDLEPDEPGVDQCGTCTRCLDACPTGAITAPYVVDARRCLSYLTIEKKGTVAPEWRESIREQVFGCDICQDVCPWNRRAATSGDPAWQPREPLRAPRLIDLCRLSDDAWRAILRTSAMRRAGLRRIRRSLAYATAALPPVVGEEARQLIAAHPSGAEPEVRDALEWARTRTIG